MKHTTLLGGTWSSRALRPAHWPGLLAMIGSFFLAAGGLHAQPIVTTIGGGNTAKPYSGYVNGNTLTQALFSRPAGLAMDPSGTILFVADYTNNAIRAVAQAGVTATSTTTTFASITNAISRPLAVAVDGATNVYVLNRGTGVNGSVLRLAGAGGALSTVTTLTSGLTNATALALDSVGNCYVTVNSNKVIRIGANGLVTPVGTVATAGTSLLGIAVLSSGQLALSDAANNGILTMNPSNGATANLTGFHGAGDTLGTNTLAAFRTPAMIAAAGNNLLVVADSGNDKVKVIDATGTVTLLYGVSSNLWVTGSGTFPGWADGYGTTTNGSAESRQPYGVVVSTDGSVFASEDYYDVLRHVSNTGLTAPRPTSSGGGGGTPSSPTFNNPGGIAFDSIGNYLYVANPPNDTVQVIDLTLGTNATSTILYSYDGLTNPVSVLVDGQENLYVLNRGASSTGGYVLEFDMWGNAYGQIVTNLNQPTAFGLDGSGNILVAEQAGKIRAFGSTIATTLATVTNANVSLQGLAIFDDSTIAVSDAGNAVIWALDPVTRLITKLTGQLGKPGVAIGSTNFAELNQPRQLTRAGNNTIVAADYGNNRVLLVNRAGYIVTNGATTVHLNPADATLWFGNSSDPVASTNSHWVPMTEPVGVAVGTGGTVFVAEDFYSDIRQMSGTLVASPSTPPSLSFPAYASLGGLALNSSNTVLYVTDPISNTVSMLDLANNQTAVVLNSSDGIYQPVDVALDLDNNLYVLNQGTGNNGSVIEFDQFGYPIATNASSLAMPTAMKMDFAGNLYIAELYGRVREFSGTNQLILADIATNANVQLQGIAPLLNGNVLVSDAGNNVVWSIPPTTNGIYSLFTGAFGSSGTNFGPLGYAKLNQPKGIVEVNGGYVLIADSGNNRVVLADDTGTIYSSLLSSNASLWFGTPTDPVTGGANFVSMVAPNALALSPSGTVYDSETLYRDVRGILATGLQPPVVPPPPVPPRIGWYDYEEDDLLEFVSVLHPIATTAIYNNVPLLAIDANTNGVQTFFINGSYPLAGTPSKNYGEAPNFIYHDGIPYDGVTALSVAPVSNLVIKAVNIDGYNQASAVTTAQMIFQVGNPMINGYNGAQFTVSDVTTNGVSICYTIDGTDPNPASTNAMIVPLAGTNAATLSLIITTNVLFKAMAFNDSRATTVFLPSGISSQIFTPASFVANTISFGFASGEASSDFITAPGQNFVAPVTLTTLPATTIYSLQFNITVTNAGPNPGPKITPNDFGFDTMLEQPDPAIPGLFVPIYTWSFAGPGTNAAPPGSMSEPYNGNWYNNLQTIDTAENLLTVGWVERAGATNLYNTKSQDLITYSQAHDDLFPNPYQPNGIILGGYIFNVPGTATNGQTYQIQIGRPSATSDGIGIPGSSVYIAAPTNGAMAGGSPMNALKNVTVGQIKYLVGSVYPFRWFNAGDFGGTNIVNADVEQVFESAIYGLNAPPSSSDFFDAMDSCGGTYTNLGNGYLQYASPVANVNALFNGDDTTINNIAFGDGVLDVCDVYVTFRRSLDPGLTWFQRYWNNGQRVAQIIPNVAAQAKIKSSAVRAQAATAAPAPATNSQTLVNFAAVDTPAAAGQTVQVPITASVLGNYPLRVLMLNLTVTPLDGSPSLTTPVQFTQTATVLGAPLMTSSQDNENFAAVWLDSTNSGITGSAIIGYLTITVPANATAASAYAIHFDHASASPNGLASFPKSTLTGLVTLSSRTNSSCGDGIPDSWRLRWFGTVYNMLSASNACPSGDGVNNWMKYVAGVNPNVANDFPSTQPATPVPAGYTSAIHWPSVAGTQYVVKRSSDLFNGPWTVISTNIGTGGDMEFDDTNSSKTLYYRVLISQ